jgi:hypothetical protein
MYLSLINEIVQLRLTFDNQANISSSIHNFGRLTDMSRERQQQQQQPSQISTGRVVQLQQQQQPQFSWAAYPQSAAHYVTTSSNPIRNQPQSQNDQCKFVNEENYLFILSFHSSDRQLENLYYSNGSSGSQPPSLSQTFANHGSAQSYFPENVNNAFADLSSTVPARTSNSSYTASWDPPAARRSTSNVQSSSIFGGNPFAATNPQPAQRPPVPPPPPEPSPHRSYVASTNAARSLEGDDRPIFGGARGRETVGAGRGRGRMAATAPIQEQESPRNGLQRRDTFVLDQPSLPNLPQSGAQRPRDTVVVQELYNVRRRKRAQTPVAFTINLAETPQLSDSRVTGGGTI